ncbi:hypothetical protein GF327_05825, partial [Candidatus Woesearchaeota archaeon]|nr:hypothetical protein [Candidatus Woesearchaeota archaeon]
MITTDSNNGIFDSSRCIENLVLGAEGMIEDRINTYRRDNIYPFLKNTDHLVALVGHPWYDGRGVDAVLATNFQNAAKEIKRYNEKNNTDKRLTVVLMGHGYNLDSDKLKKQWGNPELEGILKVEAIDFDPESLGLDGVEKKLFEEHLTPAGSREEFDEISEKVSAAVIEKIKKIYE